jgi:arylsulfatase A-like enzyme
MKRRTFLKSVGLAASGLAAASSVPDFVGGQAEAEETKAKSQSAPKVWADSSGRPNILVIIVDQMRFPQGLFDQALMDIAAPNLAELRRQSVSFDYHCAAAAMCSPSRSTMLTGLYSHQNGMFLTMAGTPQTPSLQPGFPTWGSILSSAEFRYNTYWWGKWHLSANDTTTPDFAEQYGFNMGGLPCPSPNTGPGLGLGTDPVTTGVFTSWLNDVSKSGSGPWCTTVSLLNPHDVAWFPGTLRGRPPLGPNPAIPPQPGEDNPPSIFHQLPANFERWPEAGLPPESGVPGAEGKPRWQEALVLITDLVAGKMPTNPGEPGFPELWHQLLDLYVQVTHYVDEQIGLVLYWLKNTKDKNGNSLADNTIVIFTSDHGEYGGAHGLRNKGFAVYDEAIRVPFYVYDPTGTVIPPDQRGTTRNELTSHVDILPLLMTLASGGNSWRGKPQYAHLAGRADLFSMLSDPTAKGRDYILHTSDENQPELANALNILPPQIQDILDSLGIGQFKHVIGYRTKTAKLGVYSRFAEGTIDIVQEGQQAELYNYEQDGVDEVINHAPGGSAPDPVLFETMYGALFNPSSGAVANELRRPLPSHLKQVQRRALDNYLAYMACYADSANPGVCPPAYQ